MTYKTRKEAEYALAALGYICTGFDYANKPVKVYWNKNANTYRKIVKKGKGYVINFY